VFRPKVGIPTLPTLLLFLEKCQGLVPLNSKSGGMSLPHLDPYSKRLFWSLLLIILSPPCDYTSVPPIQCLLPIDTARVTNFYDIIIMHGQRQSLSCWWGTIGLGDEDRGHVPLHRQKVGKIFFGQLSNNQCKILALFICFNFRIFSGKNVFPQSWLSSYTPM